MARVLGDVGAFAVAIFGRGQDALFVVFGYQQGNDVLALIEVHAAHTPRAAAHRAHIVFVEPHGLARVREQHHVVFAVGQCGADQVVAVVKTDRDDAALARVREIIQRCLLHCAVVGRHEHVAVGWEGAVLARQRQHHIDALALLQREHVDDGTPARVA